MTDIAHLRQLLTNHTRRLHKLQEQRALQGYQASAQLLLEIEDVQAEIERLQSELAAVVPKPKGRPRIFISHSAQAKTDSTIARQLHQALDNANEVFVSAMAPMNDNWATHIEAELSRADYFIVLLSAQSIQNEMVLAEIKTAHYVARETHRPIILPIRVAFKNPFPYPANTILDPLAWTFWQSDIDTPRLIDELQAAVAQNGALVIDEAARRDFLRATPLVQRPAPSVSAQPLRLEAPEGTMDPQSRFYIERPADPIALDAVARQGVTLTIKGPRQMGKSSLLLRTMDAAAEAGKRVIFLDFQLFEHDAFADADTFFRQFCFWISDELLLDDQTEKYWATPLGNSQRATRYMSRYVLRQVKEPVLLAMDEVENIFEADFRSDFFGMLRSWHNQRRPRSPWKRLDLALVTSTEPYQLIDNLNQSPFNVGEIIPLDNFSREQVADLNRRHRSPLDDTAEGRLFDLLRGQPYLTRRALYLVAGRRLAVDDLFRHAADDESPFGDHLRYHLFRLTSQPDLLEGMKRVLHNGSCPNEQLYYRLQGAGLVQRRGQTVTARCPLYHDFFSKYL